MSDTLVVIPICNERDHIGPLLHKIRTVEQAGLDFLFVDDGSNDGTEVILDHADGVSCIHHERTRGCGPAVRTGIEYGLARGYGCIVIMAGNGKDDPAFLSSLTQPVLNGDADMVLGSRYLRGGRQEAMPIHRRVGTRLYSLLASLLLRRWITDATNGFRAIRADLLRHEYIDLRQSWLTSYEVESYILSKAVLLGFRVTEAPVTKTYPRTGSYSKMKAFSGWWSHFRPVLFLGLGLKH